jgi:hypothetical protein
VAPGSEYTLTTDQDGPAGLARVAKWGKDTEVTDEAIKRRNMDPVAKGLLKLVNSAGLVIDQAVVSVIASAVTATRAGFRCLDRRGHGPEDPPGLLQGQGRCPGLNLGYEPNALLVDDLTWAYLASDPTDGRRHRP